MDRHCEFVASGSVPLGFAVSSNQAEYQGLIEGIEHLRDNIECDGLFIRGDSELVIYQLLGEYNVNSPYIRSYYNQARRALKRVGCAFSYLNHIDRYRNSEADALAKEAADEGYCYY